MRSRNTRMMFSIIFLATLGINMAQAARAQCSNSTVAGKWGFTTDGTVVGIGPRASVGIFALDAFGNLLDGKASSSLNGSVTNETFSGTYTMSSDCTATVAIVILDTSGNKVLSATLDLVFDNNARELRGMFTSAVLPNGTSLATVITASGKRLFSD